MATYKQEYTVLAEAIVTRSTSGRLLPTGRKNAIVVPTGAEVKAGEQPSLYYYTDSAAWDTGAQFTLISPRIVEALGLQSNAPISTTTMSSLAWTSSPRPTSSSPTLTGRRRSSFAHPAREGW